MPTKKRKPKIDAELHHRKHGDMVRTSNGNRICGLSTCSIHYPAARKGISHGRY